MGRELISPTFAPALKPESRDAFWAPREAVRRVIWEEIVFWKTTAPMTTEIEVEMLRVNWNVDVPAAISFGGMKLCKAIRGAWKSGPIPIPATIWYRIIFAQEEVAERFVKRP